MSIIYILLLYFSSKCGKIFQGEDMKKFFKALLVIIILCTALYLLNAYYDNILVQKVEDLFLPPVETTVQVNSDVNENEPSISEQVYNKLSEPEQKAFNNIYSALSKCKASTTVPEVDNEKIFDIVELVISQHPEIFWWDGRCTIASGGVLKFSYTYSRSEVEEINAQIKAKANEILTQINPQGSDFDKSLAIFDYIVLNTSYNYDAADNMDEYPRSSTIEGVFLDGTAICSGYSKAYQYLLKAVGVDSVYVTGQAQTPDGKLGHAWVLQETDGYYYFTDATWGDSYEKTKRTDFVNHTYFCTTNDELAKTHTCTSEFYKSFVTTNDCNSYFKRKNLQFDKYSFNDTKAALKNEFKTNKIGIEMQFNSDEEYQIAVKDLFEDGQIHYILMSADLFAKSIDPYNLSYNTDDTHNVIIIIYQKKA